MKYLLLQLKRVFKFFPFALIIVTVLFITFFAVFSQFVSFMGDRANNRFKIGVAGETDNSIFKMGISALKTFDTSRFSIDIELLDEETAKKELQNGDLSAYVVIPKGFVNAIENGGLLQIDYYTTQSSANITTMMKDEITTVISDILKESQKGIFATGDLLYENGYPRMVYREVNEINIKYIDFILDRSRIYKTNIIGVASGLSLVEYLIIGLTVTFVSIFIIPFVCLFVKKDRSIIKLMHASGKSVSSQVFAEYLSLILGYIAVYSVIFIATVLISILCGIDFAFISNLPLSDMIIGMIPVTAMVASFSFFVFETAENTISAVTGYFFITSALCYISGCIYPVYALPKALQKVAEFTPMGAARVYLSNIAVYNDQTVSLLTVIFYIVLFLFLSIAVRKLRLIKGEGLDA